MDLMHAFVVAVLTLMIIGTIALNVREYRARKLMTKGQIEIADEQLHRDLVEWVASLRERGWARF
jgi:hypothetical protein